LSPKVSIEISATALLELHKTPRVRAADALAAARADGISLRPGAVGVVAGLADWHVDHHQRSTGVSLAGAILLHLQPEPGDSLDPLVAAAEALGVSLAWMEGAEAGWGRQLIEVGRLPNREALRLEGHVVGASLLAEFGYGR
jgi:hypothetical protein